MNQENPQPSQQSPQDLTTEKIVELGSSVVTNRHGTIHCLTIIGQIEGHTLAPTSAKTTKYEHMLPLLASLEESDDVDGVLILLNTVGGDVEAGRHPVGRVRPDHHDGSLSLHDRASRAHERHHDCLSPDLPLF